MGLLLPSRRRGLWLFILPCGVVFPILKHSLPAHMSLPSSVESPAAKIWVNYVCFYSTSLMPIDCETGKKIDDLVCLLRQKYIHWRERLGWMKDVIMWQDMSFKRCFRGLSVFCECYRLAWLDACSFELRAVSVSVT